MVTTPELVATPIPARDVASLDGPHPLIEAFARLRPLAGYLDRQDLHIGAPAGDRWVAATELTASGSPWIERLLDRVGAHHNTSDRAVMASFFFSATVGRLAITALGCLRIARRAPDLSPANVLLRYDATGTPDGIAFCSGRFAALADDPASGHPDATVLDGFDALRRALAEQLAGPLTAALIERLAACTPLGRPALRAALADRIAGMTLYLSKLLDQQAGCAYEVDALLDAAGLGGRTGVIAVEHKRRRELFLRRAGCCLAYRLPAHGHCATCPLQPAQERERRLREAVACGA